jgi:protein TonB
MLYSKKSLIVSCALHALCFLLFAGVIFNHRQKLDNVVKPETGVDISFVSNTTHQGTQKKIKKPVQKPVQKTVQTQKAILEKSIKPVLTSKKVIAIKQATPILPVKIADIQEKSLSQFKSVVHHTDNAFAKSVSVTHDTNATSKAKDIKNNITIKTPPAAHGANNFNKDNYIAYVKQRIANYKFYPNTAKRRGIEGRVGFKISIKSMGDIDALDMIQSSGSDILDQAALQAVRQASPFKPPHKKIQFSFGIQYDLHSN